MYQAVNLTFVHEIVLLVPRLLRIGIARHQPSSFRTTSDRFLVDTSIQHAARIVVRAAFQSVMRIMQNAIDMALFC